MKHLAEGLRISRSLLTRIAVVIGVLIALLLVVGVLPNVLVDWDLGRKAEELSPAELADAKNSVRTTLLQAVGGLILVAGATATWRTIQVNRESQITERFTRAIDQLGNRESLEVRLGGIYALERIARDSKTDHGPVMEVLTAFVRERASLSPKPEEPGLSNSDERGPNTSGANAGRGRLQADIQAAVSVIGRRNVDWDTRGIDLRRTDLRGADLLKAHLREVDLFQADLREAVLIAADLRGANFEDANLSGAILVGADLREADLSQANLRKSISFANFRGANLTQADLQGAALAGADLREADLSHANLHEVLLQASGVQVGGMDLGGIPPPNFQGARASHETVWPEGFDERSAGVITVDPNRS